MTGRATRYRVKEIFYTLQGEGRRAGRAAVFCRFTGCNLWTGHESDRATSISCGRWCDTEFVGQGPDGGRFAAPGDLARAVAAALPPARQPRPYVVCTGGEPLLQLDVDAVEALHRVGFEVAVETNGTLPVPAGVDWVCVSPKAHTEMAVRAGDEIKLVYPQPGAEPGRYEDLAFVHWLLQPMDGPDRDANTRAAIAYCLAHPRWSLSLQTHKIIGVR